MRGAGRKSLPRICLDTNVIISALISQGTSRQALDLVRGGAVTLVLSPFILEEAADVLRAKFAWDEGRVQTALEMIKGLSTLVSPVDRLSVVKDDTQDNRIVECAFLGRAAYLVSGDKHILSLGGYRGILLSNPSHSPFMKGKGFVLIRAEVYGIVRSNLTMTTSGSVYYTHHCLCEEPKRRSNLKPYTIYPIHFCKHVMDKDKTLLLPPVNL